MQYLGVQVARQSFGWADGSTIAGKTRKSSIHWLAIKLSHKSYRNCGRIFCADCSENSTPLPNEHLYNPVRVCTSCYTTLRRNCPAATTELADKCKHSSGAHAAPLAANAQLTASSN